MSVQNFLSPPSAAKKVLHNSSLFKKLLIHITMIKNLLLLALWSCYTLLPTNALGQQTMARNIKKSLRVLLIDGQNNHDTWKAGSAWMQGELEATGLFKVDIARTPEPGQEMSTFLPDFSKYDVVVSNYNGDTWPEATQKAFEYFVRQGGGFVVVHAADRMERTDRKAWTLPLHQRAGCNCPGYAAWPGRASWSQT